MENKKVSINIVLTCFNRKEKTLACLQSIMDQNNIELYNLNFFICDDASTDGTAEAILRLIPNARIASGTGNLFWTKGMAMALDIAQKEYCDFYLMVNDDVLFKNNMIDIMIEFYNLLQDRNIAISGAIQDPDTLQYTYGGERIIRRGLKEVTEEAIPENGKVTKCDRANWNCFLISKDYYEKAGKIDDYYAHSYADYDYSNRIIQNGGKIYVSPSYVGYCKRNSIQNTWRDKHLSVKERIKKLHQPKGFPPKSAVHYWRKFDRKYWIFRVLRPYLAITKDGIQKHCSFMKIRYM